MDFKETDKIVTIFSEQEGKIKAIAKGIKKPRSSLRACVQPFCHAQLFISRGKGMDLITQGKLLDFYGNCREDINRTLYIMYIMELLDKSLLEKAAMPALYKDTVSVLEFFNQQGLNLLALRFFEMSLLSNLGYKPVIDQCVRCGKKDPSLRAFNIAEGGLLCHDCAGETQNTFNLSAETNALIRLLSSGMLKALTRVKASPQAMRELEMFLEKYLEYYLERKFYMKNTIRTLKKTMFIPD